MIPGVAGRQVAVVGRAASIHGSGHGAAIDAADVVLRVNWTLPLDPRQAEDVGTRTDLVYHCLKLCEPSRISAERVGVPTVRIDRELRLEIARSAGKDPSVYQPNTGTVAVVEALRSGAAEVLVFGMDFFRSGHVAGQPLFIPDPGAKRFAWEHDPAIDARIIRGLVEAGKVVHAPALEEAIR